MPAFIHKTQRPVALWSPMLWMASSTKIIHLCYVHCLCKSHSLRYCPRFAHMKSQSATDGLPDGFSLSKFSKSYTIHYSYIRSA
uniref:Putative secreted protein n=1 Tax=Anopheles marajoara TaxID=58244 RepID=A0A2M4CAW3_9DIPT